VNVIVAEWFFEVRGRSVDINVAVRYSKMTGDL
jgi:hypothetical protein